jgi:chemotaxis protein MotB
MQRRPSQHEDNWLMSYADLITNLLLFFVILLTAASVSTAKMQQVAKVMSGEEMPESLAEIKEQVDEQIKERSLEEMIRTDLTDEGSCSRSIQGWSLRPAMRAFKPNGKAC